MAAEYITRNGRRIEVETLESRAVPKRRRADPYIGCPVGWLKRVRPLVKTRDQLAIAMECAPGAGQFAVSDLTG
jgi:hypothetical protein